MVRHLTAYEMLILESLTAMQLAREESEKEKAELLKWFNSLTPAQKCTVWPPAGSGSGHGLYNLTFEQLVEEFNQWKLKQAQKGGGE
jgi:hypothetical protein